MSDRVHFIPVGFDFERLIFPISKGELDADRVVLITNRDPEDSEETSTSTAAQLAINMSDRLETSFDMIDIEARVESIDRETLYDYETLYTMAYRMFLDELEAGNEVFVNISSMPRTTAFAFATAADSLIAEDHEGLDGLRNRLHTYYVAPEDYLVLEMLETLEDEAEFLNELKEYEDIRVHGHYEKVKDLLKRVYSSGVTEGARDLNGQMHVEFPSSPGSDVKDFEATILKFLIDRGAFQSTSELAEQLAEETEEEYDESFRSRVQYNVGKLEGKGYVNREEAGNRLETSLSTMGRMWAKTH
ncbi:MarR family transcriptional regulator [Natronococcus sp. JC468]|uniref:HFX_2341 family transcriptional regulator domain-containing protein n=1 Tax=Natronococcus sp. JC468 TaxID=1961921 RepID=UPI00143C46E2|nr:DUF6293 family protein [Natronococcus sp. JC468]NKE37911.1 MarR family transcriptional regulator [Natronococcus sp. JC468]